MRSACVAALLCLAMALPPPAAAAERIVTLAPHLAELVCAAGACNRLVGVVRYTDEPGAQGKPEIGDAYSVSAEALLVLRPDLVLAWTGGTSPQLVQRLQALKIPVHWIAVRRLEDVAEALLHIGALTGQAAGAAAAAADYRARLDGLRARYRGRSRLRVFYQIEVEPMFTIGRRSPIHEAISLCGGDNVFAELAQVAAPVGTEAVIAADPQLIVFGDQDMTARIREFWRRWPQLRAVALGQLYEVRSSTLARQSPRVLDGVEELCKALDRARAVYVSRDSR